MARRGRGIPKSRTRAWAVTRAVLVIPSTVSAPGAWESARWTVTRVTLRSPATSIITGPRSPSHAAWAVRSPMNSVCPGCRKPEAFKTALEMGAVTRALALPDRQASVAAAIQLAMTGPAWVSGAPGWTGAGRGMSTRGIPWAKTSSASAGEPTRKTGAPAPVRASWSPKTTKGGSPGRAARQAAAMISGPIPAGSPSVTARGAPRIRPT